MLFNFDSLPRAQRNLWPDLYPVSKMGFVLYGGTALALRFGHRQSVDFDFFSTETFMEEDILNMLPFLNTCEKTQSEDNSYSYQTEYGARITFLGGINFGRLGYPDMDVDTGIQIASLKDLFALKLSAACARVELKDFMDIAELLKHKFPLDEAISGVRTLIKGMLPAQTIVKTLMWYEDLRLEKLPQEDKDIIMQACARMNFNMINIERVSDMLIDDKLFQTFKNQHPDLCW